MSAQEVAAPKKLAVEVPGLDPEGRRQRNEAAIQLLREWTADESGCDEETWPELKEALNRNRGSARKLFVE